MKSLILVTGARLLIGLFLLFSVYMLLRGHNAPGGGFIGGLIGASGFVLYAFAAGAPAARRALRVRPQDIGMAGLALGLIAGLAPMLAGAPPFTGLWLTVAGLPLSTVLLFDTGVYLAVFGAMLTLVFALEEAL